MMMKSKFYRAVTATCILLALCGCQQREHEATSTPERTVRFNVRSIETKSAFGAPEDKTYPTFWTDNDKSVGISLNYGTASEAAIAPSADYRNAWFEATFSVGTETSYAFYAISPSTAAETMSPSRRGWTIDIPTVQTPLPGSVEESAQLLVARTAEMTEIPEQVDLSFRHLTAYARIRLNGLESLSVEKVDFIFGTPVVGEWYYACSDGSVTPKAASSTITAITDATGDIWLACAPADLSGTVLKIIVYAGNKAYTKEVSFPDGRQLASGRIAAFTVDMTDAVQGEVPVYAWRLLTDAGNLAVGDRIIIANEAGNYAISTTQNTNNRGATAVTVNGEILNEPSDKVEILTLEAGSSDGFFAMKTLAGKYLAATNARDKNYLKSVDAVDSYASWTFSISDNDIANVLAKSGERNRILYNPNAGNPIFSCYKNLSPQTKNIKVYRYASDVAEPGVAVVDDPLLAKEAYGAYLNGTDYVFDADKDQLRRTYGSGTQSFSILTPLNTVLEINGIPSDIRQGSSFTVSAKRTAGKTTVLQKDYKVTVIRESGPRFWLSDGKGNGFIIKK